MDPKHVIYVRSMPWPPHHCLGYGSEDDSKYQRYWPADRTWWARNRFHTIIWPIMLMALDYPSPRRLATAG